MALKIIVFDEGFALSSKWELLPRCPSLTSSTYLSAYHLGRFVERAASVRRTFIMYCLRTSQPNSAWQKTSYVLVRVVSCLKTPCMFLPHVNLSPLKETSLSRPYNSLYPPRTERRQHLSVVLRTILVTAFAIIASSSIEDTDIRNRV